jgi:NodT family efflux transporter outer membrane factor (OMF) lipoprotein
MIRRLSVFRPVRSFVPVRPALPRRASLRLRCACLLALTGLSACTVGPAYRPPAPDVPASFKEAGVTWQRVSPGDTAVGDGAWWKAYGDAELDALVDRALAANPGVAQAEANWRQAVAAVGEARAAAMPQLGVGASGSRGSNALRQVVPGGIDGLGGGVTTSVAFQANASWEPDLWGGVRQQARASQATADAAGSTWRAQRLSTVGTLITTYLSVRQLDIDTGLLERQVSLYRALRDTTEAAHTIGTASFDDVLSARNALDQATVALTTARISREQAEHAVAVLCGSTPAAFTLAPRPAYQFTAPPVPASVPSQVLRARPDIAAAERQMAAANAQIGVAVAAWFPSVDLTASGGYQGGSMSHLFSAPNEIWSLGPALAASVFDGFARRSREAQARAGYDAAVAAYRQTVLAAMQEVEDDLSSLNHLGEQRRVQEQMQARQATLLSNRKAQQAAGTASQSDVLTDDISDAIATKNAADAQAQEAMASVKLRIATTASDL